MEFICICNDPHKARQLALSGIEYIMVDLEVIGKELRQGHLNTVISRHSFDDISQIRTSLDSCHQGLLLVRINPFGSHTRLEIDQAIARGADRLMLPMYTHPDEVRSCLDLIDGRVPLTLLLETSAALARLPQVLSLKGDFDFHIGLNDLHLDMGLDFMFELLSSRLIDHAAKMITDAGIVFGIGGVSSIGSGDLPAHLILSAHKQLGSERVILSRSFSQSIRSSQTGSLSQEVAKIRDFLASNPDIAQHRQ